MEKWPLPKAQRALPALVHAAVSTKARFEITYTGGSAVLLSAAEYDSLVETLDVLSDADLVQEIRTGLQDLERQSVYTQDQVAYTVHPRPKSGQAHPPTTDP